MLLYIPSLSKEHLVVLEVVNDMLAAIWEDNSCFIVLYQGSRIDPFSCIKHWLLEHPVVLDIFNFIYVLLIQSLLLDLLHGSRGTAIGLIMDADVAQGLNDLLQYSRCISECNSKLVLLVRFFVTLLDSEIFVRLRLLHFMNARIVLDLFFFSSGFHAGQYL